MGPTCFYDAWSFAGWQAAGVDGGMLVLSSDPHEGKGSSLLYGRFVHNTTRTKRRMRGVFLGSGRVGCYAKYDMYDVCNGPYPRGSSTTRIIRGVVTTSIVIVTAPICFCAVDTRVGALVSHYYTHCLRVGSGRFCFVVTTTRRDIPVVRHAVSNFHNFLSYLRRPGRYNAVCNINT